MTDIIFEFDNEKFTINSHAAYSTIIRSKGLENQYSMCDNFTPLMYIIIHNASKEYAIKQYILKHKDELNKQNSGGHTALMIACRNKLMNIVEMLIEVGCDLNLKNKYGETCLSIALMCDQENIVKLLLDNGADINFKRTNDDTAVSMTFYYGNKPHLLKLLLNNHVDLKMCDGKRSGFESVCKYMQEDMVKYCLDTHKYYDDIDLVKCLKISIHKRPIASYLAELYYHKVGCFKLY